MLKAMIRRGIALVALTAIPIAPSSAEPPAAFAPSGAWRISGDDGRCLLSRGFSDGTNAIAVQLEAWPTFGNLMLSVTDTNRLGTYVIGDTDLRFADGQPPVTHRMMESFDSTDGVHRVHQGTIDRKEVARIAEDGAVTLAPDGSRYVTLRIPKLAGAVAVLAQCENLLLASAGLSVDQIKAIRTMPLQRGIDYTRLPASIAQASKGDLEDVGFAAIVVSPAGRPTACNILHRAKSDVLNAELCEGMKAKFDPARDARGQPVIGIDFVLRRWERFMRNGSLPDPHPFRHDIP